MKINKITDSLLALTTGIFMFTIMVQSIVNLGITVVLNTEILLIIFLALTRFYTSSKYPDYENPIFLPRKIGFGWKVNLHNKIGQILLILVIVTLIICLITSFFSLHF